MFLTEVDDWVNINVLTFELKIRKKKERVKGPSINYGTQIY